MLNLGLLVDLMNQSGKIRLTTALVFILLCLLQVDVFAGETLWKSGQNLYIKLAKQDKYSGGRVIPNQHPVALNPREIRNALGTLLVWNKSFFTGALKDDEEAESVFSLEQTRLLGTYIAAGLQKATANQDIVFALTRRKKSFLFMKDTTYTGGRVFYVDGKLNVILGDYDKLGDKFLERANQSSGVSEIKYYIAPGKRKKRSGFKKAVILADGLSTYEDKGKTRKDWFVIDVKKASVAFENRQNGAEQTSGVDDEKLRKESAKSARERREMRLEMARLRKEMKEQSQGNASDRSVEERLEKLQNLKDKNFITEEEYKTKRAEILGDI